MVEVKQEQQRGITLVELLAVIVILGIIAAIAVPAIGAIIEKSKENAFVGTAFAMKEAASMHQRVKELAADQSITSTDITYDQLVADNYIEAYRDPFTKNTVNNMSTSYIKVIKDEVTGKLSFQIRLVGETKSLCDVPASNLSIDNIINNGQESNPCL